MLAKLYGKSKSSKSNATRCQGKSEPTPGRGALSWNLEAAAGCLRFLDRVQLQSAASNAERRQHGTATHRGPSHNRGTHHSGSCIPECNLTVSCKRPRLLILNISPGQHSLGQFKYKNHLKTRFGLKHLFSISRITDGAGAAFSSPQTHISLKISTGVTRLFGSLAGSNNSGSSSSGCESQLISVKC